MIDDDDDVFDVDNYGDVLISYEYDDDDGDVLMLITMVMMLCLLQIFLW